jgi:hypothetical protein
MAVKALRSHPQKSEATEARRTVLNLANRLQGLLLDPSDFIQSLSKQVSMQSTRPPYSDM